MTHRTTTLKRLTEGSAPSFGSPLARAVLVSLVLAANLALAQDSVEPKVIVVPYPGMNDAGVVAEPPIAPPVPAPPDQPPPPVVDPTPPPPETRTIEATQPTTPPPVPDPSLVPSDDVMGTPVDQPGAFIDGHPREGAFLSGPGSMTFVLHHTLLTGLGVLATQMIPRAVDAYCLGQMGCTNDPNKFTGESARIAYLAGSLIGAGVGFGASAWWQFNHWISHRTANFGIANGVIGGMFLGALTDLIAASANPVDRAYAVTWTALIGSLAGAWLTAIIGGGDLPLNKGTLIVSGAGWAMIYTALIIGMIAAAGAGTSNIRAGIDAMLITPAIGAGAMAFATLKFNPSTTQIMRANLFGVGVGAAVFLLSGLVLGLNWSSSVVPYVLGALGAIGAKTVVSIFWVEAAENPNANQPPPGAPPPPQNFAVPAWSSTEPKKVSPWW